MRLELDHKPLSYYSYLKQNSFRKYITKNGKEYKKLLQDTMREMMEREDESILEGDVFCYIELHFNNKRKNDVDNFVKPILDCYSGICYNDDRQVVELLVRKFVGKECKMIIEFKEVEKETELLN